MPVEWSKKIARANCSPTNFESSLGETIKEIFKNNAADYNRWCVARAAHGDRIPI
jgi:hypothetical protein